MAFTYERLGPDQRLAEVDTRLDGMERQHYQCYLNILVAGDENTVTQNQATANQIEQNITKLREERDALQQQVGAAQASA